MSTFSPYHRNGHSDKQPRYNIQKLSDFGWTPGPDTPSGRATFVLDDAILMRDNGGFLVNIGNVFTKFYPPDTDLGELTNEVVRLMSKRAEETELPDNYGLEGVA